MRWIFAAIGFVYGRLLGALAGFWLGYMFEQAQLTRQRRLQHDSPNLRVEILQDFLTLALAVARADGDLDRREVRSIRDFFERAMGFRGAALDWLKDALKTEIRHPGDWRLAGARLAGALTPLDLSVLLRALLSVAMADGRLDAAERQLLETLGRQWRILGPEFEAWQAPRQQGKDRAWALKIFGLGPTADAAEIERTYKRLVREKHPDRFAHLGEQFQAEAHELFVEIQEAHRILMRTQSVAAN